MNVVTTNNDNRRVVSGMRTTGRMHLGNYHGALKNWVRLQHEYDCYFFAADWHALTTHYEDVDSIEARTWDMLIDWLACGLDPNACKLFIQSGVPEHAELHLLLSMVTPLGWLERVPTYKDQIEKLRERDLATYGFLGYPVLQSADILMYRPGFVPVGEDQVSHIEITREIARRFNYIFGRESDFQARVDTAIANMGKKQAKLFKEVVKTYQEKGDVEALEKGQAMLSAQANLAKGERERLSGYLEGTGKQILPEPQVLLTETPKLIGVDGQKMSKSYHNTIEIGEADDSIAKKIKTMPTDPARVKRSDPGTPSKCPVWNLHQVYTDNEVHHWVKQGCTTAGIGCLDCKKPLIDAICKEQGPIRERATAYREDIASVKQIVQTGTEQARDAAKRTLREVKEAIGIASL